MRGVWKAYKVFNYIKLIGAYISGVSVLGMMFVISYDVFARTLFSESIRGGFEIIQNYFMPLVVFPALTFVYASGVLPKMDLVLERLSTKFQKMIVYIILFIEIFVLILIVQFSWEYALGEFGRKAAFSAGGTMYPLYPIYFLIPITFTLIIIENIFVLIRNLTDPKPTLLVEDDSELEASRETVTED